MFKRKHRPPKWLRVIFDRESEKGLGRPWKETRARIERVIRKRSRSRLEREWFMRKLDQEEESFRNRSVVDLDGFQVHPDGILRKGDKNQRAYRERKAMQAEAKRAAEHLGSLVPDEYTDFYYLNDCWFIVHDDPSGIPWDRRYEFAGQTRYSISLKEKKIYRRSKRQLSAAEVKKYGLDAVSHLASPRYSAKFVRNNKVPRD